MEFGSEFVYHYDDVEYEYISDEELEDGMNISSVTIANHLRWNTHVRVGNIGTKANRTLGFLRRNISSCPRDVEEMAYKGLVRPILEYASPLWDPSGKTHQDELEKVQNGAASDSDPEEPIDSTSLVEGSGDFSHLPQVELAPPPGLHSAQSFSAPAAPVPRPAPKLFSKKAHHWRSKEAYETAEPIPAPAPQPQPQQTHQVSGQRVRQGDTNVVSIKFDKLIAPSSMHAGDPQVCEGCSAILSKISKVTTEGEQKFWDCEFCEHRNLVDIENEEIPTDEDVTFMLEPALSTTASGPSGLDEALVVFCVDTSGSMCVTTEVPGHVALRGAESLRRAQRLNREREDQFLPRQRRDVTYVSRLQSVQAAIDHQLQEMEKEFPNRRVALVTFNNEVTVIGDGKSDPVTIAGDKLGNKDTLQTIAGEQSLPAAIKVTRKSLGEKVFELEEGGPTALGPALLVSTTMASKFRGSKVILCTDGLANVGMGKLDNFKDEAERDECVQFYEDVAGSAAENGVSVSVITIKGTDCRLVELGKMADKTGGQVNIVDPLKLTQEFSTILANKIIATNVVATFILHKELFFFYEETEESKVVRNIGNVTADTEITFEFGVRTKPKAKPERRSKPDDRLNTLKEESMELSDKRPTETDDKTQADKEMQAEEIDTAEPIAGTSQQTSAGAAQKKPPPSELPFQLQVVYTDTEGAKAMRLLTKTKPITKDRQQAERACNLKVLGAHTAQTSAKLALEGQYTMSRQRALMNQRVAWRHTETDEGKRNKPSYKNMFGKIRSMENCLNLAQQSERSSRGKTYSDSEDSDDEQQDKAKAAPAHKLSFFSGLKKGLKKKKHRSATTSDTMAEFMYKGKTPKSFFDDDNAESS